MQIFVVNCRSNFRTTTSLDGINLGPDSRRTRTKQIYNAGSFFLEARWELSVCVKFSRNREDLVGWTVWGELRYIDLPNKITMFNLLRSTASKRAMTSSLARGMTLQTRAMSSSAAVFVDKNTRVICQGITGKHGTFHTEQVRYLAATVSHSRPPSIAC